MHVWYATGMTTERVTITLPIELVAQLDAIAEARGASRSSVVREASAQYVTSERQEQRASELKRATGEFFTFLDELREGPVLDDRPVLDILRELRGGPIDSEPDSQTS